MNRRIVLVDIGAGLTLTGLLPSVALFASYSARLTARGGNPPYTFAIVGGALPTGLALDSATGIISGTASAAGSFGFTVRVTDLTGATVDRAFAILVQAEPLSLSGAAPAWTVGTPYSYTYTAANGVPPYTWSLAAGALPAGLALNTSTGNISGTPTEANAPAWTVRVTDSAGTFVDLRDHATLKLIGTFAAGTVGTAYSSDVLIDGGDLPYSNPRITVGALPAGLALSIVSDKLRLSGTPSAIATSNFTAAADSGDGQTAMSEQSIVVANDGDPYWSNVSALLHFDPPGNVDSQNFIDQTGKVWTKAGNPTETYGFGKFGNGSLKCIDSTDGIIANYSSDFYFGSGNFTIECFIEPGATYTANYRGIVCCDDTQSSSNRGWLLFRDLGSGFVKFACFVGSTAYLLSDTSLPSAGFTHFAACRDGGTLRLYRNGIQVASTTISGSLNATSVAAQIGILRNGALVNSTTQYRGNIDELRITKGICRYPGGVSFDVPTSAFPNH